MTENIVRITRNSKNLRFGWTSQTEQTEHGLRIRKPEVDDENLSPRQLVKAYNAARRINSGNDWRWVVTIDGREVVGDRTTVLSDIRALAEGVTNCEDFEIA